jgi:hypothetical protein
MLGVYKAYIERILTASLFLIYINSSYIKSGSINIYYVLECLSLCIRIAYNKEILIIKVINCLNLLLGILFILINRELA